MGTYDYSGCLSLPRVLYLRGDRLTVSAWVHNVFDEDYAVHGFYFGNDPRTFYANTPYTQYGPPRVAGLTLDYRLGE